MNLWLSFNKALTLYGAREAIVDGHKRFTYEAFGRRVANLVKGLHALGIQRNDIVAMIAPNGHEFMEAYFACGISGIVLSPINFRLASKEITQILRHSGAKAAIVHTDFAAIAQEVVNTCPDLTTVVWLGPAERANVPVPTQEFEELATSGDGVLPDLPYLQPDELAQIYYTSGTTGTPKGVMLTQGNVAFNSLAVIADLRFDDSEVWLHAAPMFHLADAWATFAITWVGGTHVFVPYFRSGWALEAIHNHKITRTVLVPTMLNAMLNDPDAADFDCSSLRMLITGGSPIAPDLVRKVYSVLGCDYVQLYGMTETSPFLTVSAPLSQHAAESVERQLEIRGRTGRPYIGAEVKVVRPDGTEVERNNLEVGEIIARGPTIFAGYWKEPELTAQTIKSGWIHTGDLAVIDREGYINVVDRAKDMIITGGENVYSTEVEYVLHEHPAVLECAVAGIPDKQWGESVKAFVVRKPGQTATELELTEFVRARLAHYKTPRSIDFLDELPKTGTGKIYKKGLREKYWNSLVKQVN
jgi:acyl-CoA synthetase (AMP-forming)/AMP-acid ligase II